MLDLPECAPPAVDPAPVCTALADSLWHSAPAAEAESSAVTKDRAHRVPYSSETPNAQAIKQ